MELSNENYLKEKEMTNEKGVFLLEKSQNLKTIVVVVKRWVIMWMWQKVYRFIILMTANDCKSDNHSVAQVFVTPFLRHLFCTNIQFTILNV